MTENFVKELRACRGCHEEYEAKISSLMGVQYVIGVGYCPKCQKKRVKEEKEREEAERQAEIAKTRLQWRQNCGIPLKFMNEEFGTFDKSRQVKAYEKCLAYAKNFPLTGYRGYPSLLLYSDKSWGIGKSHLACSIGHNILNRWNGEDIVCPIHFTTEPDLLMRIYATYNYTLEEKQYRESETDIINRLISVPLLILDDIGKRRTHDPRFVQRIMFALIDGRYRAMKPMVITANLTPERLKVYLGGGQGDEASYDRLLEMCGGGKGLKFFCLEGESYRRRKE